MPKIVATKEDWIKLGYTLFSNTGVQGLVVEQMATKLKCNKSSFYWHFKNKANFIEQIVAFWVEKDTQSIIEKVELQSTPKKKLLELISISYKKDANLDFYFYLKKYAQSEKSIKNKLDKIDTERIGYVSMLLVQMGYKKAEATVKAKIFYKHLIGYHEMIRYKRQQKTYLSEVIEEINHFIILK